MVSTPKFSFFIKITCIDLHTKGDLNGLHSMRKRTQFFDIYLVIVKSSGGYWSGGVGRGGRVGWVVGCRVLVGWW